MQDPRPGRASVPARARPDAMYCTLHGLLSVLGSRVRLLSSNRTRIACLDRRGGYRCALANTFLSVRFVRAPARRRAPNYHALSGVLTIANLGLHAVAAGRKATLATPVSQSGCGGAFPLGSHYLPLPARRSSGTTMIQDTRAW